MVTTGDLKRWCGRGVLGTAAAAALVAILAWCSTSAAAPTGGGHAQAQAALADVRAALEEIVHAEDRIVNSPLPYHHAARRAINALVGRSDPRFDAASGTPGDDLGAAGHVDKLLDREGTPVWTSAIKGAQANMLAAVASLQQALGEHEVEMFLLDATSALTSLEMAQGRPARTGALGGLEGALATTRLGIPDGARVISACTDSTSAPAYATAGGYLIYVAVPAAQGTSGLPEDFGSGDIRVRGDRLIVRTGAAALADTLCRQAAATSGGGSKRVASSGPAAGSTATAATNGENEDTGSTAVPGQSAPAATNVTHHVPALYTETQARAGKAIFEAKCTSCHGRDLQGISAPTVAGSEFLKYAKKNDWTMEALQYTVTTNMPFNAPGTLSPKAYAELLAFLLAANCYPAGDKPFPISDVPRLAKIHLGPVPDTRPDNPKLGTCTVK